MTKRIAAITLAITCLVAQPGLPAADGDPTVNPGALAGMEFGIPGTPDQRVYLGVSADAKFVLADVKADYLVVAVFNTFCTICQSDAPVLNMVYEYIEESAVLKGRTKIVGIAAGNTEAEVTQFRKQYEVPFPLFADAGFSIDRAIPQNMRTPMLITMKKVNGRAPEVVKWHMGRIDNVEDLVGKTLHKAIVDDAQVVALRNRVD